MATYAGAVVKSNLAQSSDLPWLTFLEDTKKQQETLSGIRQVPRNKMKKPADEEAMISRENVEFAELFLYNNPHLLTISSIPSLYEEWQLFLKVYLKFQFTDYYSIYSGWVSKYRVPYGTPPNMAFEHMQPLHAFLCSISFVGTVVSLQRLLQFHTDNNNTIVCAMSQPALPDARGYTLVGDTLWETSELRFEWHITADEIETYEAPLR